MSYHVFLFDCRKIDMNIISKNSPLFQFFLVPDFTWNFEISKYLEKFVSSIVGYSIFNAANFFSQQLSTTSELSTI